MSLLLLFSHVCLTPFCLYCTPFTHAFLFVLHTTATAQQLFDAFSQEYSKQNDSSLLLSTWGKRIKRDKPLQSRTVAVQLCRVDGHQVYRYAHEHVFILDIIISLSVNWRLLQTSSILGVLFLAVGHVCFSLSVVANAAVIVKRYVSDL